MSGHSSIGAGEVGGHLVLLEGNERRKLRSGLLLGLVVLGKSLLITIHSLERQDSIPAFSLQIESRE